MCGAPSRVQVEPGSQYVIYKHRGCCPREGLVCGQEALMCFSFPEFRGPDEEKGHLLITPPLGWGRGQVVPST